MATARRQAKTFAMKTIPLTQHQVALVSDEDYADLSQFRWFAHWSGNTQSYYAVRSIRLSNGKRTTEWMHRRILGLEYGDKRQADHRNHDTLDNRRENLRIATRAENQHNSRKYRGTTSRLKGVCRSGYDAAARQLHGKFALLNFPNDLTFNMPLERAAVTTPLARAA